MTFASKMSLYFADLLSWTIKSWDAAHEVLEGDFNEPEITEDFTKDHLELEYDAVIDRAKGIAEIITVHGYINVDFADVQTVMSSSGVAIMGSATATGENRAGEAIAEALTSPLLNNNDITVARSVLLNITS